MTHLEPERASPRDAGRGWRLGRRSVLGVALLLGMPMAGQTPVLQAPPNKGRLGQNLPDGGLGQDQNSPDQKRIRLLNAERQKALISDTEKLLKLARELNDELAASDAGATNDEEVRKVAEIGKLAKSVKDKMSYSLGGVPAFTTPLTTPPGVQ